MAVTQYEYYYDNIDFDTWVPNLLVEDVNDRAGQVIEAAYWNAQWNKHKTQGDYNSKTIDEMLRKLNQSVWSTTDSLAMLYHADPTLAGRAEGSVSEQLDWALTHVEQLLPIIEDDDGARHINVGTFAAVASDTVALADSTLSAILTYLRDLHVALTARVDGIAAGALGEFNHNDLGGRDVAGAHTTDAITHGSISLNTHLSYITNNFNSVNSLLNMLTDHMNMHTDTEGNKHAAANISVQYANNNNTVQAAIDNLYLLVKQATGDIAGLEISHESLPDRTTSGHPAGVITLSDNRTVQEAITALETDFRKIYAGTAAPTSDLGNDGDIYIQYA